MDKRKSSFIYVGLSIILWASTAAIGKLLLTEITGLQLIFYTFPFTIISLFLIAWSQNKLRLLRQYTKTDYLRMIGMGFLGCYLYYLLLFGALKNAPAQEAFIVNYLWPVMVVIFAALLLKEQLTWRKVLGILISFIGVYIVITKGDVLGFTFSNLKADLFSLVSAIAYGLFSVLGKKDDYERLTSILVYYVFGFIFVAITVFLVSSVPIVSFKQLIGLAWLGVMTNGLAFVFWFKALEYGDTAKMANYAFLAPFLSLVYIYFLLGERILLSSVIGLIVIVVGILFQASRNK